MVMTWLLLSHAYLTYRDLVAGVDTQDNYGKAGQLSAALQVLADLRADNVAMDSASLRILLNLYLRARMVVPAYEAALELFTKGMR